MSPSCFLPPLPPQCRQTTTQKASAPSLRCPPSTTRSHLFVKRFWTTSKATHGRNDAGRRLLLGPVLATPRHCPGLCPGHHHLQQQSKPAACAGMWCCGPGVTPSPPRPCVTIHDNRDERVEVERLPNVLSRPLTTPFLPPHTTITTTDQSCLSNFSS